MKKTIVLFLLALFIFPFLSFKTTSAESINDLSCAKGVNLLDPTNLLYTASSSGSATIHNIYLNRPGSDIIFEVKADSTYMTDNLAGRCIFYDVDFNEISRSSFTPFTALTESFEGVNYYYFVFESPSSAFSFSFGFGGFSQSYIDDGYPDVMLAYSSELLPLEDFVASDGIFNLSDETPTRISTSYSLPLDEADLRELVSASDGYDGSLNSAIVMDASNYLNNSSTIGSYEVTLSVTDSSGNVVSGHFYVDVYDNDAPIIEGSETLSFPVNTVLTDEDIISHYTASDAYDGDLSSSIIITTAYQNMSSIISSESLTLKVSDSSDNYIEKTITLSFYDNVAPVFDAIESLSFSYQVEKTVSEIMSEYIKATDNIDSSPVITITSDTYTGNERKIGSYTITFEAKDDSLNSSSFTININIYDDIKPVIYLDKNLVETLSSIELSSEDFTDILYQSEELKKGVSYDIEVLSDTYSSHKNEKGTYTYKVKYTSKEGDVLIKSFVVKVTDASYKVNAEAKKEISLSPLEISLISVSSALFISLSTISFLWLKKRRKISDI
ncbi:MAG: hypothetical protein H6687_01260 [Bacillales bacterium]|nr:hypothetical protein [Bacillales bacterium]